MFFGKIRYDSVFANPDSQFKDDQLVCKKNKMIYEYKSLVYKSFNKKPA